MYVCTYVYVCTTYVYMCTYVLCMYDVRVYTYAFIYVCIYVLRMYVRTIVRMYVCMYVCMCVCMYVYAYNLDPTNFVTETVYRCLFGKMKLQSVTAEVVECCALSCPVFYSCRSAVQRDTYHYHLGYTRSVALFTCIMIVQLVLQSNTGLYKLILCIRKHVQNVIALYSRTQGVQDKQGLLFERMLSQETIIYISIHTTIDITLTNADC